jgi:cell wall assembly regulator SMI1
MLMITTVPLAYSADRGTRSNSHADEKAVMKLLADLDQWMRAHRADLYKKLNPPATDDELRQLEAQAGMALPPAFKALLKWRNGQPDDVTDTFHPLTNEMFASSASMLATMRDMDELAQSGDISAESWSKTLLPFMDDGGGDLSCLDLKTGRIVSRNHETQEIEQTHASVEEWLKELVRELSTNNFANWDIKESRGP